MNVKPKVLVTGATGFAGSHLADLLIRRGYPVRVLTRTTSDLRWVPSEAERVIGDVREPESLKYALQDINWVFHFGGLISARNREEFFVVNAAGTRNLFQAFLRHGDDPKLFLLCSSLAAVGPGAEGVMLKESGTPRPVTAYGASKRAGEEALLDVGDNKSDNKWEHQGGPVRKIIVRPPAVYGPRDPSILKFFRWVERGWIPLPAPQNARFSVIHVDDLALGTVLLAEQGLSGTYHLSDGESHSWLDLGERVASQLHVRARHLPIPFWISATAALGGELWGRLRHHPPLISRDKVRELRGISWVCSIEKARSEAGYQPSRMISEGLKTTIAWYRDSGWL
ncbi:MAG: NAD-dependent epimerase/dehydratase family protein [Candidatus Eisenbacteria bacterium]|uniref:NAD-dependent epimerase/dehydratase family protein n=1 Tax=Eiseniibacteriota bacterium TaxID=2212470 RepID=A0A948RW93_UNCEI|nr:NAD-dependent epimerase/dehydratase family protein [Candidatus Eisenbacteria bacterium]MBU1950777.1 NAD-dependent epimerase/dehydratase family protein [Candidatus Eisenbacteria bacterium]MBU2690162.1 NAD-dependent epimerase/dehydratase family protein [Candidatus Eisenbacteria bacterium]